MLTTLLAQVDFNIRDAAQTAELPGYETAVASGTGDSGFSVFVGNLLTALFAIAGLLLLLYLIWGGIDWITSGGDSGKVGNARNKITQAAIGLIVFASAFAIVIAIQSVFDLDLINFTADNSSKKASDVKYYISEAMCKSREKVTSCVKTDGGLWRVSYNGDRYITEGSCKSQEHVTTCLQGADKLWYAP